MSYDISFENCYDATLAGQLCISAPTRFSEVRCSSDEISLGLLVTLYDGSVFKLAYPLIKDGVFLTSICWSFAIA